MAGFFSHERCVLFCSLLLATSSAAEILRLHTYEREPFIGKDLPDGGYLSELISEVFKTQNYTVELKFVPIARAKLADASDGVAGFFPARATENLADRFLLSDPIPGDEIGLLKRKSFRFKLASNPADSMEDVIQRLTAHSVGVVHGVSIHPAFDRAQNIQKQRVLNDIQNIDKLALSRLDLVVIDKYVAASDLINHRPHLIGDLEFVRPPLVKHDFHVAFARDFANATNIQSAFNRGLAILKKNGKYGEILDRHGLKAAAKTAGKKTSLTIGTVNNSDMKVMQRLSNTFETLNPDISLTWKVLDENTLRQRLLSDLAISEGEFDVMMIGAYETPIWARKGWISPMDNIPDSYALEDVLPPVRDALSMNDALYALPFNAESSMTFYRQDLFDEAGLSMSRNPTYEDLEYYAAKIHRPEENLYGICLRGKPGWGENMALVTTMVNTFGGRWFDMKWQPELNSAPWQKALTTYKRLLTRYGPPNAASNGFNENLELFSAGHCGIWVDASVAAGMLYNPNTSKVHQQLGFAQAPVALTEKGASWLWTWALAIPTSSKKKSLAMDFILWATSKDYIRQVAMKDGWVSVPPGTRRSTYQDAAYLRAAPFAEFVLSAIESRDIGEATLLPKPYPGIQFVGIHEFPAIGNQVGLLIKDILLGVVSVERGLQQSQYLVKKQMKKSGYYLSQKERPP